MKFRIVLAALVAALVSIIMAAPSQAAIFGPPVTMTHNSVDEGYYNTILIATNNDYTGQKALGRGGIGNAYSVYVRTGEEIWCDGVKSMDATGWHNVNLGSAPWQFTKCDVRKD